MERRLIDANALPYKVVNIVKTGSVTQTSAVFSTDIAKAPTIDAVEVVRCEKCLHSSNQCRLELFCYCRQWSHLVMRNHYCSCGVRREPDANNLHD